MILDEITNLLTSSTKFHEAASTGPGVEVWSSFWPDTSADTSVVLFETGGTSPLLKLASTGGVVAVERPGVQVITRAQSYQEARNLAQDVWNLFVAVTNSTDPSGAKYLDLRPEQSPIPLGADQLRRERLSMNFSVRREST